MTWSEERVTTETVLWLKGKGWEVLAVHPPDGQGPFVVFRKPIRNRNERSSYHPDVVAIRPDPKFGLRVLIVESKGVESDLSSDIEKIEELANDNFALRWIVFKLRRVEGFGLSGFDYEGMTGIPVSDLPIQFLFAASGPVAKYRTFKIRDFDAEEIIFEDV